MDEPKEIEQNSKELEKKVRQIDEALQETTKKLQGSREELEAHEALLRLAFEDMRRIYDDLQKSQAQLVQADKLATIGLLSAGIAHEINNPLAAVKMAFALLKMRADLLHKIFQSVPVEKKDETEAAFADIQKFLQQGSECADNMQKIVQDIKMFSRSDKGTRNPENINRVIDSVISVVWSAVKYNVTLNKEYGELPLVRCNAQQLGQVFLNLLVNASQAMDGRGSITLRTYLAGSVVKVDVIDTGPGIPADVKARIFEPFFTTKGPEKGTGLGLSISHDIIKKHNGTLEVESEVGKGTKFTVSLPIGEDPAA